MVDKEYLEQVRNINKSIRAKMDRLKDLKELSESVTPKYSDMPKGNGEQDKIGACASLIADYEMEIQEEIAQLISMERMARKSISMLPNPKQRLVLELRYLNGLNWDAIADTMGYFDGRNVRRLCARGLEKMALFCPPKAML